MIVFSDFQTLNYMPKQITEFRQKSFLLRPDLKKTQDSNNSS